MDKKWNFSVPTFIKQLPLKVCPAFLPRSFHQPMWTKSGRNVDEKWTESGNNVDGMWKQSGKDVDEMWKESGRTMRHISSSGSCVGSIEFAG